MRTWRAILIAVSLLATAQGAAAQLLTSLFPEGVPGYGAEPGVTVQSRVRPEYDPLGIRVDTLMIKPLLSESIGYDNNIFGGPAPHGAWEIATRPSVLLSTDNSDGGAAMFVSASDVRYLGEPSQNRTDGAAFLGGTIDLGRDKLTLGGGYLAQHEDRTELDALPSDRPVGFAVANARVAYAAVFGAFTATPSIDLNRWRFDNTTILGVPISEAARDRTTAQAALNLRYNWMSGRDLLLVTRVLDTHYDDPAPGLASNNSTSWQMLLGADYDDDTVWRYRILVGGEYRQSASAAVASQSTPIAEAEITWSPSGLTTVRATAIRGIEDAAQTGLSSYTYTRAKLTVDHEYLRNVLLNASATVQQATFNQTGGQQLGIGFGAGATWLVNRTLRLSLTYDFADVRNEHLPVGTVAGDYTRGLTMLTLRVGL
jgi:hypothetical protein